MPLPSLAAAGSFLGQVGGFASGLGSIASAFGIGGGGGLNRKEYRDQIRIQNKVWRESLAPNVDALKSAGIHPLVGFGSMPNPSATVTVGDDLGSRMERAGQGLGRAGQALMSQEERVFAQASAELSLERQSLENELLRSQITNIHRATNPAFPSEFSERQNILPGQPSSSAIRGDVRRIVNAGDAAGVSGLTSDVKLSRSPDGSLALVPGDVKQDIEDMILPEVQWWLRRIVNAPNSIDYNPFTGRVRPVEETRGYKIGRKLRGYYNRYFGRR